MTQPNVSFFTPSMNDPALLEAIFTARHWLAEQILAVIRDTVESGSRHYLLLYGPRGIGKTHFVSLMYYRVRFDEALHSKLHIAWLQEDPYAVSSYPRLLRAILSQLDMDYSLAGWPERLAGIENLTDTTQIERALERTLLEFLGDKVLLLIAENLDEVFAGLGEDGQQKLRAFLQTKNAATILATSTSLLPDLEERDRPFFQFFKKYPLAQFSFQDCVDVLVRIAEYREDHLLANTLRSPQGRARIHAIHHLAGGNPRIYVMFYQFLSRESLDELIVPFMQLVDELMPYYQARMQILSPQQRTLIDVIRRNESPTAVREIAKAAFISSQSASRELKTLRDLGYVDSNSIGRESLYELREPLMRICLSAKEQRGQSLPLFIDFLRIWFTPAELKGMSNALGVQTADYERYHDAIEESRRRYDAFVDFERSTIITFLSTKEDDDLALAHLFSLNDYAPDYSWARHQLRELLVRRKEYQALIALTRTWTEIYPEDGFIWNEYSCANHLASNFDAALQASSQAIALLPENALILHNHLISLQAAGRPAELSQACARALQITEVADSYEYLGLRVFCLTVQERWEEVAEYCAKRLALHHDSYESWRTLHVALQKLNADQPRAKIAKLAVELFSSDPLSWRDYATALRKVGQYEEALGAHNKAVELAPNEDYLRGERLVYYLLLNDLEAARDSLTFFDAWRQSRSEHYPLTWLAQFWLDTGERAKAVESLAVYVDGLEGSNDSHELSIPVWRVARSKDAAAWKPLIDLWIEVYEQRGKLAELGPALVQALMRNPALFAAKAARDWLEAWKESARDKGSLRIPLRMMEVGVEFIETGERTALFELLVDQRSLLEPEIDRYLRASGKLQTDVDRRVDQLVDTIRSQTERSAALIAPLRLDEAKIEDLLETYDTKWVTTSALRPLSNGERSTISTDASSRLLKLLSDSGRRAILELSRPNLRILRIEQTHLDCSSGFLYQAHISLNGRIGSLDFWCDGERAVLLDGTSVPVYALVSSGLVLTRGEAELSYVVFLTSMLRADQGRFDIVSPDDEAVVEALRSKSLTFTVVSPVQRVLEGREEVEAYLVYADNLFRSVLRVDHERNGLVEMVGDEPLFEHLGLPTESFDGAIRFWAASDDKRGTGNNLENDKRPTQ